MYFRLVAVHSLLQLGDLAHCLRCQTTVGIVLKVGFLGLLLGHPATCHHPYPYPCPYYNNQTG